MNVRFSMLKRDFRLFMRCLIPAAVLTAAFAAVCAAAAFSVLSGAEDVFVPVQTAVIDEEDSLISRLVVGMVSRMEYISDMMEVTVCDSEEAMSGLQDGRFAAVITLPDGTMEGILSGRDTKGTIHLSSAAAAHADVVARTAAFGEVMLCAGQYGIFSGEQLIREHELEQQFYRDFLDKYNALLLSEAVNAGSSYFDIHTTDYADTQMSTAAWYCMSWMILLLMLLPILFAGLYTGDLKKPLLHRLRALGVSDGRFLLGKLLFPLCFACVLTAVFMALIAGLADVDASLVSIPCAALGVLLATICGGSIMMSGDHGMLTVAAVSTAGILLCGGLIPRQLLPETLLQIGTLTPFGAVQNLLLPLFGARMSALSGIAGLVYIILLPCLVKRRLAAIRIGGEAV